jgi:hypothetical protein
VYKEIELSSALGKTLEGFKFSITCGQAVLTFTDGTFCTLGVDTGLYPGDEMIEESKLELFDFGHDKLIALGIISQEEMNEKSEQRSKALSASRAQRELETYDRLKRKFER